MTIALLCIASAFHCWAESGATFENQTTAPATVKIIGAQTNQMSLKPNDSERLRLRGGEYYFKVRFDLPAGPRYAVGPYFDLVDEVMLKHEVTVPLKSPALVGLYEISKEQFDNDAGDSALLRKANSVSKEWVRWASIVLAIVSEKQEETSKLMSKGLAQLGNDPITSKNYQGLNVGLLEAGSKVSIRDIIKQYGEPSGRRTTKKSLKKDEAEVEFDVYSFDVIELQCRKGSDDVEWLNAPMMWFVEGIRKKAQRTLERAK